MTRPFRQLHHICLVVRDIDAAIAYYEGIGIGPLAGLPPLSQFTDLYVPNPEAFGQLKYRYVDLDNVQIHLCEPPQLDCPQRRFLDTTGKRLPHRVRVPLRHSGVTDRTAGLVPTELWR